MTERLLELAIVGARIEHFDSAEDCGHADPFVSCPHPNCVLVRGGSVPASTSREAMIEALRRADLIVKAALGCVEEIARSYPEKHGLSPAEYAKRALELFPTHTPREVLNPNARERSELDGPVDLTEAQRPIAAWLKAHGFIETRGWLLAMAWGCRDGYDFTDLEFFPTRRHANDAGFIAIIGHHASGENPRTQIGFCETLEDVQRTCEAIRLINGYRQPELWPVRQRWSGALDIEEHRTRHLAGTKLRVLYRGEDVTERCVRAFSDPDQPTTSWARLLKSEAPGSVLINSATKQPAEETVRGEVEIWEVSGREDRSGHAAAQRDGVVPKPKPNDTTDPPGEWR